MRIQFTKPDFKSPLLYYVTILSTLGLLFVFLVPPFQSPDEQTHLYRAYQLSEGTLITKKLSYGAGDILPTSLSASFNSYDYLLFQPDMKLDVAKHKDSIDKPLNSEQKSETRFENTAAYPPLAYLPQVIAISIGKLFSAGPVVLLYLARLANVLVWVLLLWLSMKRQPRIALPLFAFALLPIVLFQSASASADVMTAGIAIFFSLELLLIATKKSPVTRSDSIILLAAGVTLALCKMPYILLVLLVLTIPTKKFSSVKKSWQFKLSVLLIPFAIALLWTLLSLKSFVNLREIANTPAQLSFILHQPLQYAIILLNTYLTGPSDGLYMQMIGVLGWLDTKLTFWSMLLSFGAVLLAAIGVVEAKNYRLPSPLQRIAALTILGLIICAISTALYLTWNAPGARLIDGLQGRYYIPLIGVIIIVTMGLMGLKTSQQKNVSYITYTMLGLSIVSILVSLAARYYQF
ncbi:DUF2142 domain-containing protein [Candidatus Saccharibacteria bacterium]|nr:DUF2142 domain-containing protein [Candidatus Saccharibacteria bacterium]